MTRQIKLLVVLALILAGAIFYAYDQFPVQESFTGDINLKDLQVPEGQSSQALGGLAELKLEFDTGSSRPFTTPKKDIFGTLYPVKPKPKPKPKPIPKPKPVPKPIAKPAPIVKPPPVEVSRPIANFNLLGYLDKESVRTVFLGLQDEIFILQEGDSFAQEYHVVELSSDRLSIRRETDNREIVIKLEKPNQ